jgi:hypothetical protein
LSYSGGMQRIEGPRSVLVAMLDGLASGWWHLGKPERAVSALEAARALRDGEDFADAGHAEYVPVANATEVRYSRAC